MLVAQQAESPSLNSSSIGKVFEQVTVQKTAALMIIELRAIAKCLCHHVAAASNHYLGG